MKLTFFQSNKINWAKLQVELSDAIIKYLACGKDFEIEFSELKESKSNQQLRGYWRLISLIQPFIEEDYGIKGKDEVSDLLKMQCKYYKEVFTKHQGYIILVKSLRDATKEDLMGLIEKIYFICEFYEIKDYELKPQERRDLEEYFKE